MCLIAQYRANIGRFDLLRGPIRSNKMKSISVSTKAVGGRFIPNGLSILLLCLLYSALGTQQSNKGDEGKNLSPGNVFYNKGEEGINLSSENLNCYCCDPVKNVHSMVRDSSKMCNKSSYKLEWNKIMKRVNGNREHSVTIAHWNGGASQLGKSSKGIEKLEQLKLILSNNKIDIPGISEANLKNDLDPCNYRIDGFDCIKSGGETARTITYIKSNLNYKVLTNQMENDCAENWL